MLCIIYFLVIIKVSKFYMCHSWLVMQEHPAEGIMTGCLVSAKEDRFIII